MDILRVFGCLGLAHIPKDERNKFDSKTKRCIFLGYGAITKAYRLYDVDRKRVFYSRDVIFDESKHGIQKEQIPISEKEVPLKYRYVVEADEEDVFQEEPVIPAEPAV